MDNNEDIQQKTADRARKTFWSSCKFQNAVCVISFTLMAVMVVAAGMILAAVHKNYLDDRYYRYYELEEYMLSALENSDYEKSILFQDAVVYEARMQTVHEMAEIFFEENGEFDPEKTIDLMYLQMQDGESGSGIFYRVGDLFAWADEGWNIWYLSESQLDMILQKKKENPEYAVNVPPFSPEEEAAWNEGWADESRWMCIEYENYLPVDGKSLYSHAEDVETLSLYTSELHDLIGYVKWCQEMWQQYQMPGETESSVSFAVVDPALGMTYCSFPDYTGATRGEFRDICDDLAEYAKQNQKYLIFHERSSLPEGTIKIAREKLYKAADLRIGSVLYLVWDDTFPADDAVKDGYVLYRILRYGSILFLTVFGICLILFLVSLIRRAVLEGREDGQRKRRIDRWFTVLLPAEIFAAGAVGFWMLFYCGGDMLNSWHRAYRDGFWGESLLYGGGAIVWIAATAGLLIANTMYFGLELKKRFRQRTLWEKSFLRFLLGMMKRLMRLLGKGGKKLGAALSESLVLMNGRVRWVIGYVSFLFINLIVICFAFSQGSVPLLILMGIVDLMIGGAFLLYFGEQDTIRRQMSKTVQGEMTQPLLAERFHGMNRQTVQLVNDMELGISRAVDKSLKDERMRAELITNVSHDIRTPLTSIINYVDLLKKEPIESDRAQEYIRVLDEKSARLKQLTDDLMEASKITSGNITLMPVPLSIRELVQQIAAEYEEKLSAKELTLVMQLPEDGAEDVFIGDSRHVWRVLSNLLSNVCKYAMPHSRVYVNAQRTDARTLRMELKNMSEYSLNISPEELTERFVRGDESRTQEGNGLGLSIAKSLMNAMHGTLELVIDGDLFKVILQFPTEFPG